MNFTSPYIKFKEPLANEGASFEIFLTNSLSTEIAAVGAVIVNYRARPAHWDNYGYCWVSGLRATSYDLRSTAPTEKFKNLPTDAKIWVVVDEDEGAILPRHFCKILDEESILVHWDGRTSHTNGTHPPVRVYATSVYTDEEYRSKGKL